VSDDGLFRYTQCGLDNIWLAGGFRVVETDYGRGFAVDNAQELHQVIARDIVDHPQPLRGQEARFLRSVLNLSQADMARLLGVDRTTVVRWEGARTKPLNLMADIAIRATYTARAGDSLIATVIRELQEAEAAKHSGGARVVFDARNSGWHRVAA